MWLRLVVRCAVRAGEYSALPMESDLYSLPDSSLGCVVRARWFSCGLACHSALTESSFDVRSSLRRFEGRPRCLSRLVSDSSSNLRTILIVCVN